MINETELKILAAFFPEGTERTTREIEERTGYSHERVYSTLNALEKRGILSKKMVGKALVHSINNFNDTVYLAFVYGALGRKEWFIKKYPVVWKAIEELADRARPELLILFGSYAKGEARGNSDVDILCINGNNESEKIALTLRHNYNLEIVPVIVKKKDFRNIKIENPEFWTDIINFGIVWKGLELFYELVYRGRINGQNNGQVYQAGAAKQITIYQKTRSKVSRKGKE